jgi:2-methylcitrate dehydratase PrpD
MSGPLEITASTELLTGLLSAAVPATALAHAARSAGALFAAGREAAVDPVYDRLLMVAHAEGVPPQASVLWSGPKLSAPSAACLNAARVAGAADDLLAPALFATLAIAEMAKLTPQQFLEAFTIGAEVSRRLAGALATPGARPFIAASAVGQFGATLSVCRALGLGRDIAASALGLSAVQVTGNAPPDAAAYRLSVGNAARVGIEAACIAKFGANGPQNGVVAIGLMLNTPQIETLLVGLGESWAGDGGIAAAPEKLLPRELLDLLA